MDTIIWRITELFIVILILGIILDVSENLFHMSNLGLYIISFSILAIALIAIGTTIGVTIQKRF